MRIRILSLPFDGEVVALAKASNIPLFDQEDIAQELRIAVWRALPKYASDRGAKPKTFVRNVMQNCLRDLVRFSSREKRRMDVEALSLDELLDGDDGERCVVLEISIRRRW